MPFWYPFHCRPQVQKAAFDLVLKCAVHVCVAPLFSLTYIWHGDKPCFELAHNVGGCSAGTLPPEYAALTNTQILHVAGNLLTGRLPEAYFNASAFGYSSFLYLYLNNLSGPLPAITPNCPLCNPRLTLPGSFNGDPGRGSGLILEPMRAGFGARCSPTGINTPTP